MVPTRATAGHEDGVPTGECRGIYILMPKCGWSGMPLSSRIQNLDEAHSMDFCFVAPWVVNLFRELRPLNVSVNVLERISSRQTV